MAGKPSYVGTLNAIANGERGGHELFKNWSAATKDKTLRATLNMVAVREMEHSFAFEKRLNELGFDLQPTADNPQLKKLNRLMKSKASDTEKFAAFGIGVKGARDSKAPDPLLEILADKSIDPVTGGLIGRFICEERDSGRELEKAYRALNRRKKAKKR